MILHISCDDQFVRYVDKQFLEGNDSSKLVVCDYNAKPELAKHAPHMNYIQVGSKEYHQLKKSLSEYSGIIFHGLFGRWSTDILDAIPKEVKVGWVCWDAEIFCRPDMVSKYMHSYTKILKFIKCFLSIIKFKIKKDNTYFVPKDRFLKIKYCLCDMPQECESANRYLGTELEWLPYNYYSINETIGSLYDKKTTGKNVFLGNACSYGNNHVDAFCKLRSILGASQKVITPLSYGELNIRRIILLAGRIILGKSFVPLLDYMPLEEYNKQMLSCSVMIQNHYSPRGLGNIVTGLWIGMRVYLSEKNITYDFFKSLGVYIYSIESDLKQADKSTFLPLSDEQVQHNRTILIAHFGKLETANRVKAIINKLG